MFNAINDELANCTDKSLLIKSILNAIEYLFTKREDLEEYN